ncbi:ABC transporter ATP-binding protein [Kitasatospora sp. NBC_00240]|uniref:ABC transporter ATP-binding protein n=1 Tax=Kitasatospora sp. NBC_00240 TaxID=2903567 RepID=UPI002253408E|nr:ABC transporter ATP-binding protein [Kitasatospora sp. NBC_00240]MCX5208779.1 ABC transporter ATP-binding protein [Kitasatospora sp. NBC_00240]
MVTALDDVTIGVPRGTFVAIMGPSGSGKSTFLHCSAGLDQPTKGGVVLGDTRLAGLDEEQLTEIRRERVGFVFQAYNLLDSLTIADNVGLPFRLGGVPVPTDRVQTELANVGLGDMGDRYPGQLSGGQRQRVAIARALITRPDVIFADEPTGALDTRTGKQVLQLLRGVVDRTGQTVVMVTHDPVAASHADSVTFLADGRLAGELVGPTPEMVAERITRLGEW